MNALSKQQKTEFEAAAFRRLVSHLRERTDVQNIDLMNLAGFCRNCLSNWLKDAADEKGVALTKDESREAVYGMPYETWKTKHQGSATPEQMAAMKKAHPGHWDGRHGALYPNAACAIHSFLRKRGKVWVPLWMNGMLP